MAGGGTGDGLAGAGGNLHADFGAANGVARFGGLLERNIRRGENFLGFLFFAARAFDIDFLGALGSFGEDDHAIGQNLRIAAENRDVFNGRA